MPKPRGDHYGGHAADYLKYRPSYPDDLYQQLSALAPHRDLAWDCGTGNGQAAVRLAQDFNRVLATDLCALQLDQAKAHQRVDYQCREAHLSGLDSNSVALITAASAVHWFEHESFYAEVQRVLSPQGILAVWTYAPDLVSPQPVANIVRHYANVTLEGDWPLGLEWVTRRYQDLPFPFPDVPLKPISFPLRWTLDELMGWIGTWSGTKRHQQRTGSCFLEDLRRELLCVWPGPSGTSANLVMPLYYRIGMKRLSTQT